MTWPPEQAEGKPEWKPLFVHWTSEPRECPAVNMHQDPQTRHGVAVAYYRVVVESDRAQAATLEIGSNTLIRIWLGGKEVYACDQEKSFQEAGDKVKLDLAAGRQVLLVKVAKPTYRLFLLRLRSADGRPIQGTRFRSE